MRTEIQSEHQLRTQPRPGRLHKPPSGDGDIVDRLMQLRHAAQALGIELGETRRRLKKVEGELEALKQEKADAGGVF